MVQDRVGADPAAGGALPDHRQPHEHERGRAEGGDMLGLDDFHNELWTLVPSSPGVMDASPK